ALCRRSHRHARSRDAPRLKFRGSSGSDPAHGGLSEAIRQPRAVRTAMRFSRLLLLLAALGLLGAQYAWYRANPNIWTGAPGQTRIYRIGVEADHPPFSFNAAGGTLTGFDVEIARALCAAMQARCEFVQQRWTMLLAGLISGRYDAALSSLPRPAVSF